MEDLHQLVSKGDLTKLSRFLAGPQQQPHEGKDKRSKKEAVNLDAIDLKGNTPLALAVASGNEVIVRLLLEKGANPDLKHRITGAAPIHDAAARGSKTLVELFILSGVYVNIKDKKSQVRLFSVLNSRLYAKIMNQTPLHYAALHASPSVAVYLISVGANVTLKNKSGRRPIDIARERGHQTVVDALLNCDYEIEQQEKLAATQSYKIALTSTTEKDQNKRKKKPNKKGMNRRLFKAVIKNDLITLEKLLKLGERGGIFVNGTSNRGLSSIYLGTLHFTPLPTHYSHTHIFLTQM